MSGMLYALVALGFVLIFKASGVFNFAQGAMVLVAALAMARLSQWIPQLLGMEPGILGNVLAFIVSAILMFVLAVVIERWVLRYLVNQEGTTLLMATIGISYLLDGLGQIVFGSSVYSIDVGMPKDPAFILESMFEGGVLVSLEDLSSAVVAALLVVALAIFFQYTSVGRALRAVADDHQAAQSIGIPLNRIWVVVWTVAGLVALVAGIIWGSKYGVQFTLSTAALRALPVVILGGLTSVPGAIVGGLIIGVGEKVSEVDEVVVLTGFRPDLSWLSELRLDLDPILQAPTALAPLNWHVVKRGETLLTIARKLKVSRADLAEANYLSTRARVTACSRSAPHTIRLTVPALLPSTLSSPSPCPMSAARTPCVESYLSMCASTSGEARSFSATTSKSGSRFK